MYSCSCDAVIDECGCGSASWLASAAVAAARRQLEWRWPSWSMGPSPRLTGLRRGHEGKFDSSAPDLEVPCRHLAGSRQDRPLPGDSEGSQCEDSDRARVRSRRHRAAQAILGGRHRHRGCRTRWSHNRHRAGRRVPSVPVPDRGRRRKARLPTTSAATRSSRWAVVPKRRFSPPLPRSRLTSPATRRCHGSDVLEQGAVPSHT